MTTLNEEDFLLGWCGKADPTLQGCALLISPKGDSSEIQMTCATHDNVIVKRRIIGYLKRHWKSLFRVSLIVALASAIQLVFPFTSQYIVDKGINAKDISFVLIILFGQLF